MATTIEQKINEQLLYLNDNQKKAVLQLVKEFAKIEKEWMNNAEQEAQQSIKRGIKDAKEGKTTSHESVMKRYLKRKR